MLRRANELSGYQLNARDGSIGKVKDFYYNDLSWTIRYLVADAGNWLYGRQVLISPYALDLVNPKEQVIRVNLTKKQIEGSPSLSYDKPVSRQFEMEHHAYHGWRNYWGGSYAWGDSTYPVLGQAACSPVAYSENSDDPHLRRTNDVQEHSIEGLNGEIGHIKDFVIEDKSWAIRYLIVSTQSWWPRKEVLISPRWIDSISWKESKVVVGLTLEGIKQFPDHTDDVLITRDYEQGLHRHHNREPYWTD
jgi:hypothetical protein